MTQEEKIAELINFNYTFDNAIKALEQEPCEDAISRQAVIRWVKTECNPYGKPTLDFESGKKVIEHLKQMPPATPQPKTGHWISVNTGKQSRIKDGMTTESVKCSECDEWLTASDEYACNGKYCPNCGAKMVEPQESEE